MATISPSTPGAPVTYQNAQGGGDKFVATGGARLHIRNGGVGSITVTITSVAACSQGFLHDTAVVVGAGTDKLLGALDPNRYADADGFINIAYSGVTSVTVAVLTP